MGCQHHLAARPARSGRGCAERRRRRDGLADRPARRAGLGGNQAARLAGGGRGGPGRGHPDRGRRHPGRSGRRRGQAARPVIGFLAAILVLAHLCEDGLFRACGDWMARASAGSPRAGLRAARDRRSCRTGRGGGLGAGGPAHRGQGRRPEPTRPEEPRQDHRFVVDHAACPVLLVWPGSAPDVTTIPPPPHRPSPPGR